ncbi:3-oxoacyl-[acyl-carrier-protein] synthase III C-terminal domain-containing protein [Micromonospora marina]|uniref:3-oxoacyl-[acyl-carrier-protein] synthase-3 n=1 Tax=Micromonospora marina TaxID=307120 RepID=A0A1C5AID2_9ACTN|nr:MULTISPECIES: 3-oxoacyl-[acyl-carrier-protein] synthase III C-terminal domain-containing protein [Micromonospora]SCF44985.1 3-oxoacyl-[acyl-carrier-protein] synthase-3 [Micromonospora marina]
MTLLTLRRVVPVVPDTRITITDLAPTAGLSPAEERLLIRVLGLGRVAVASHLTGTEMLLRAGDAALHAADRSAVRYLIHAHTLQHVTPPGVAITGALRRKLGLSRSRAFALSHLGCVAGLYAVRLCDTLLRSEPPGSTALVIAGDRVPAAEARVLRGASMLGDAAAGVLVGHGGDGDTVIGFAHRTLGKYYQARYMGPELRRQYLEAYVPAMAGVMSSAVRDAGLTIDDIALVLPHNVNRYSWVAIARHLGLPTSRVYLDNVTEIGHCFGADPFINLSTARAAGAVVRGDNLLLASAGEGATFNAMVVRAAAEG